MVTKAFSILDTKADSFGPPFFFSTTGQAVRAFKDLANEPNSNVHRHPGDYRLFHVGTFDDATGRLLPLDQVEPLGYGADYKDLVGTPVGVSRESSK